MEKTIEKKNFVLTITFGNEASTLIIVDLQITVRWNFSVKMI